MEKASSKNGPLYKKIALLLLLAVGGYLACTQVILKGNDAHFTYDRGMDGTADREESRPRETEEEAAAEAAAGAETEAEASAENPSEASAPADNAEEGGPGEKITDAERKAARIEILNGSGVKGASGKAAAIFKKKGYSAVVAGNADRFDYAGISIRCGSGISPAVCQEAAELMSANYPSAKIETSPKGSSAGKITIILGR